MNDINRRFSNFRDCCDNAPAGTYELAKAVREIIGRHVDEILAEVRGLKGGLFVQPNNSDGAHNVEATIYAWVADANGAPGQLHTAEGFGEAMNGPARERVIAQAARDRDSLARAQGRAS